MKRPILSLAEHLERALGGVARDHESGGEVEKRKVTTAGHRPPPCRARARRA
jgi:hypothetical protein